MLRNGITDITPGIRCSALPSGVYSEGGFSKYLLGITSILMFSKKMFILWFTADFFIYLQEKTKPL